jgi:hypothetical protein
MSALCKDLAVGDVRLVTLAIALLGYIHPLFEPSHQQWVLDLVGHLGECVCYDNTAARQRLISSAIFCTRRAWGSSDDSRLVTEGIKLLRVKRVSRFAIDRGVT